METNKSNPAILVLMEEKFEYQYNKHLKIISRLTPWAQPSLAKSPHPGVDAVQVFSVIYFTINWNLSIIQSVLFRSQ